MEWVMSERNVKEKVSEGEWLLVLKGKLRQMIRLQTFTIQSYPYCFHDDHIHFPFAPQLMVPLSISKFQNSKLIQNHWLRPYIDLNMELRNQATNKFERDCFKLTRLTACLERQWKMSTKEWM